MQLRGLRIVVTRPVHQAESLRASLLGLGADVILLPTIAIAPPQDLRPLREAARALERYDWLIFTSANAVTALSRELPTDRVVQLPRVAAVGTVTATLAETSGFGISATPGSFTAEELVASLRKEDWKGQRVLVPSGDLARNTIPEALERLGAIVETPLAYRNVTPEETVQMAPVVFRNPHPDWALFTSPSAFEHLLPLIAAADLRRVRLASIGPATTAVIHQSGFEVAVEAEPHTAEGLVKGLIRYHEL